MKPVDLLALLREFYRDTRALRERHEAGARVTRQYDFNNTYQYVICREDRHLSWLRQAIESMGGTVPEAAAPGEAGRGVAAGASQDDARETQALVERWHGRCQAVSDARHLRMLNVILGEAREHTRFFDQMAAGQTSLLGRGTSGPEVRGNVLPTRWVE